MPLCKKFKHLRTPAILLRSLGILRDFTSSLVGDLDNVCTFLDSLLCLTYDSCEDYLDELKELLKRMHVADLKVSARK